MIEIERKFRLDPKRQSRIQAALIKAHGSLEPVRQVDEVFLLGMDSFKGFKPGMPVVRLRTQNGVARLAYKRKINEAGDSLEHEVVVESAETMRAILVDIGYKPVTVVAKSRVEVKEDSVALALDTVEGLGDFLEIEIMAPDDADLSATEQRIMAMASTFGLTSDDLELKKYDELLTAHGKRSQQQ
jgi:adenylate cyclase, class 2